MARRRLPTTPAVITPRQIPLDYLDSVKIQAYHVDLTLQTDTANTSGCVGMRVNIHGRPRRVFYVHAQGLKLHKVTVSKVPGFIVEDSFSLYRLELPEEVALSGEQVIELHFTGTISTSRTEGLSLLGQPDGLAVSRLPTPHAENGNDGNIVVRNRGQQTHERDVGGEGVAGFPVGSVLGTHLEPTHARDLFPCVDLPSCKAVFHLTLRGVPAHLKAVSNSSILRVEEDRQARSPMARAAAKASAVRRQEHPVKTVVFRPTPSMPTYIFGFWIGDFHYLRTRAFATSEARAAQFLCCGTCVPELEGPMTEASHDRELEDACREVDIHVHVLKSVCLEGAQFCLDFSRRAFELFSRLFAVRFPLPKLDVLGLPQMHGLGMENFGAITMLQDYLLVTAETSLVRRRRIARLICHEVCHQWYGDIVTPQSFDELWLKEGLARFFEYIAVDALDPSYRVWTNFMSEVFFQAMLADAQRNSHPVVQQHNGDIASILQSFDTITYCKGASVLRMLCYFVGPARFLEGTRRFVVHHQYACATQEDLWEAVQAVCDRDGMTLNVRNLMRPWLTRAKFPVLRVRMSSEHTLSVRQEPFSFHEMTAPRSSEGAQAPDSTVRKPPNSECSDTRSCGPGEGTADVSRANISARSGEHRSPAQTSSSTSEDSAAIDSEASSASASAPHVSEESSPRPAAPGQSRANGHVAHEGHAHPWVLPLRIRVRGALTPAEVVRVSVDQIDPRKRPNVVTEPGGRAGEEVHSFLMPEKEASMLLHGLPPPPPPAGDGQSNNAAASGRTNEGAEDAATYVVINDCHSGFFTVQYECERSWALALAALQHGALNECEAMGFVDDLILALHERVRLDRAGGNPYYLRDGDAHNDFFRLQSRLEEVVELLARDRGHPAWCAGQVFLWELLIMRTSNALNDFLRFTRRRRENLRDRDRSNAGPRHLRQDQTRQTPGVEVDTCSPSREGGAGSNDRGVSQGSHEERREGGSEEPTSRTAVASAARDEERSAVDEDDYNLATAVERVCGMAPDVERACREADEHVRWHAERLVSGVEEAAEPLHYLHALRDRLTWCRAQISSGQRGSFARGGAGGSAEDAGDNYGKKVKVAVPESVAHR